MSVMFTSLQAAIEQLFYGQTEHYGDEYFQAFDKVKAALSEFAPLQAACGLV